MIILFHILVALASIAVATAAIFRPSLRLLEYGYTLTALTLGSGTYLVVSSGAHLLPACITGLLYISLVAGELLLARRKLQAITVRNY